jgi:RNA polymerase sigma-70 factor (ECF subfamily)
MLSWELLKLAGQEEEDLFAQARRAPEGDLRAFEMLIKQNQRRIVADCQQITRDESIAEDLAQEVFVKAFFGMHSFEGRSSFRHWLQVIKVHHCLNHLKRIKKNQVSVDDENEGIQNSLELATADKTLERMTERQRIHRILATMPETLRLPLVLRDMDELSYEEVAANLSISLSAVKMRIKRAREWFRARYESEAESLLGSEQDESRR